MGVRQDDEIHSFSENLKNVGLPYLFLNTLKPWRLTQLIKAPVREYCVKKTLIVEIGFSASAS